MLEVHDEWLQEQSGLFLVRLPYADRAFVDTAKLRGYCLSRSHPQGKHKAQVFQAALGLTAADAERVRAFLLEAALTADVTEGEVDSYGGRFIDIEMTNGSKRALVRSVWILRVDETFPRLVTLYVL